MTIKSGNYNDVHLDEYTGEALDGQRVREAIRDELLYFNCVVWHLRDSKVAKQDSADRVVRTRWVICNKGDSCKPDVRARLVATEVSDGHDDAFSSNTQPLEAITMLLSDFASRRFGPNGQRHR